ncbi:hypothetical protein ACFL58_01345 [Elusimicrobiota bacterium]
MLRKSITSFIVIMFLASCLIPKEVQARKFFGARPEGTPSILNYAMEGLWLGLGVGVTCGYLEYRRNNNDKAPYNSAGIGALIGMGVGMGLGFHDVGLGHKGIGAIVLRDMRMGGKLGIVAGTIYGLIRVANVENSTDEEKMDLLVDNVAWGYLGGVAVGLLIGIYEGPTIADEYSKDPSMKLATGFLRDSKRNAVPSLNLSYKF